MAPLLLAAVHILAAGWVNLPAEDRDTIRVGRWGLPNSTTSTFGLGGGISFALNSTFCEDILPSFLENFLFGSVPNPIQYVNCEEINDSIRRAMLTWSSNNAFISFVNITQSCRLGESDEDDDDDDDEPCRPELEITTSRRTDEIGPNVAAFVQQHPDGLEFQFDPITTAGDVAKGDYAIEHTRMTFLLDTCWYIDNTFCSLFHQALVDFAQTTTLVRIALFLLWDVAALIFAFRTGKYVIACSQAGWDGASEEMVRTEAKLWQSLFMIFFLISPPAFYFRVYVPCVECYDFEATVAHEIGHVLGFQHPDEFPELDRVANEPAAPKTCNLARVKDWLKAGAVVYREDGDLRFDGPRSSSNESVMYSLTTRRARTCLTANDLDGLNYLYPVCDEDYIRQPPSLCVASQRNIGWLRLGVTIAVPFSLAVVIVLSMSQLLQRRIKRRASSLRLQEQLVRAMAQRRILDLEHKQTTLYQQNKRLEAKVQRSRHNRMRLAVGDQEEALNSSRSRDSLPREVTRGSMRSKSPKSTARRLFRI